MVCHITQIAFPERQSIAYVGDAGLTMLMGEFATALKYGKPIVRKTEVSAHGGIYHTFEYFIEVINTTPNTVAKNCKGSITISGTEIKDQATVWKKQ